MAKKKIARPRSGKVVRLTEQALKDLSTFQIELSGTIVGTLAWSMTDSRLIELALGLARDTLIKQRLDQEAKEKPKAPRKK